MSTTTQIVHATTNYPLLFAYTQKHLYVNANVRYARMMFDAGTKCTALEYALERIEPRAWTACTMMIDYVAMATREKDSLVGFHGAECVIDGICQTIKANPKMYDYMLPGAWIKDVTSREQLSHMMACCAEFARLWVQTFGDVKGYKGWPHKQKAA